LSNNLKGLLQIPETNKKLIIYGIKGARIGHLRGGSEYLAFSIMPSRNKSKENKVKIKQIKELICNLFDVKPERRMRTSQYGKQEEGEK